MLMTFPRYVKTFHPWTFTSSGGDVGSISALMRRWNEPNRTMVSTYSLCTSFNCMWRKGLGKLHTIGCDGLTIWVLKIRDRKHRTGIVKYSFVNRTIKNWNQLPAKALGILPSKSKIFRNRVRKAIINGVKLKEQKCGENHLKVQWSEVRWV